MIPCTREKDSNWSALWGFASVTGNAMPPRNPDDDETEDEEDDKQDEDLDPAVITRRIGASVASKVGRGHVAATP
jgi:hypothetical protein